MSARRAVVFDIGGVLAFHDWTGLATDWCPRLGVDREALMSAIFSGNDETVLVGNMDEDDWWRVVGKRLGADAVTVDQFVADVAMSQTWDQSLLEAIRDIRERASTAILSNAWPSQRVRLQAAGVDELFDFVFLSCEVGLAKPNAAIFELVSDSLGVKPTETLFVDDTLENIAAATNLGFRGHLFVEASSAIAEIIQFLAE